MRNTLLISLATSLVTLILAYFIFYLPENLRPPQISALSSFPRGGGDGLFTGLEESTSTLYVRPNGERLRVNEAQGLAIDRELIARGFGKTSREHGTSYTRPYFGLFPAEQWVFIRDDGTVNCGEVRSRWVFLIAVSLGTGFIAFLGGSLLTMSRRKRLKPFRAQVLDFILNARRGHADFSRNHVTPDAIKNLKSKI